MLAAAWLKKRLANVFFCISLSIQALNLQEHIAIQVFEQTQLLLQRWNENAHSESAAADYFAAVRKLLHLPAISKLRKNPYSSEQQRTLQKAAMTPVLNSYFTTHQQLAHLVHNALPHYFKVVLCIICKKKILFSEQFKMSTVGWPKNVSWYTIGKLAAEAGDWRHAEFCYQRHIAESRECEKGRQALALVHYVSGDIISEFHF